MRSAERGTGRFSFTRDVQAARVACKKRPWVKPLDGLVAGFRLVARGKTVTEGILVHGFEGDMEHDLAVARGQHGLGTREGDLQFFQL